MNAGLPVPQPKPLPDRLSERPQILFTDVDDTLTWQGRVPVEAMQALYNLSAGGVDVVPVTGASAGWCDCLMKTWPIRAIVGENGAFYLYRTGNGVVQRRWLKPESSIAGDRRRLCQLSTDLQARYPDIRPTQDQPFRISEMAFDVGQAATVDRQTAQEATDWLRRQGLSARLSSIHINAWVGDHSKASGALAWLGDHGLSPDDSLFIGDSPNDESMFEHFRLTVGVANIREFLPLMRHHPRYITRQQGGHGFAELAVRIADV
ncbi:HAD-IIB family hydrolase [Marinobacter sp. JSM 1782161]|uniref:HAD-IIB family hydrolase n=1 Tax=Marinobacter sp. JSM 1782161 TaxID=2685906 RepID=UPI001403054B|nr:HAD-IIB family hydrolase [Marinobacter sp. JSM 1782161]